MTTTDVAIIGGGIIGCSIAYQLRKQGLSVLVFDQGEIGAQASSAAAGLLAPFKPLGSLDDPYLALQRAGLALFPSLVRELEALTGMNVGYRQSGTLRLISAKQRSKATEWITQWRARGVPMDIVEGAALVALEPACTPSSTALSIPEEAQIHPVAYLRAVKLVAEKRGVIFAPHTQVQDLDRIGEKVTTIHTVQGDRITCGHVVLAAGAWSGMIGQTLNFTLPVSPLQGQSILVRQPAIPINHILFGNGIYIARRSASQLVVGATNDEVGFDMHPTDAGRAFLLERAQRLIPSLATSQIEHSSAGLRPRTPDHRPVLGPAPGWKNVTLATGHNGFGVLLSGITAQTLSDVIITGKVPESINPFGVERFAAASTQAA